MSKYYSAAYSIDLSRDFPEELKRLRAAESALVEAKNTLIRKVKESDKFRLAREMAATGDGTYATKKEPTVEIQQDKARIVHAIETGIPEVPAEKPLPNILHILGEKAFNMVMNGGLLTKEEKRAHLAQLGLIKPDAKTDSK